MMGAGTVSAACGWAVPGSGCSGEARFVGVTLGGAILKDFASKIRVGSVTCCSVELSVVRLLSPRLVHDVTRDWGFPSLLKSMNPSSAVQAGLKAATCSH